MEVFLISNGCPSRIRNHGMSESGSDALPLGYWAITRLILLQLFIFANTFWLLKTIILSLLLVVFMIEFG